MNRKRRRVKLVAAGKKLRLREVRKQPRKSQVLQAAVPHQMITLTAITVDLNNQSYQRENQKEKGKNLKNYVIPKTLQY